MPNNHENERPDGIKAFEREPAQPRPGKVNGLIDAWILRRVSMPGRWRLALAYAWIVLTLLVAIRLVPELLASTILRPWVRVGSLLIIAELLPGRFVVLRGLLRLLGDAWLVVTLAVIIKVGFF